MKLLLDACVWRGAVENAAKAGHDVDWAGRWEEDPGDDLILARAANEDRVLITLDKDFAELAIVHRRPHAGIVRLIGPSTRAGTNTRAGAREVRGRPGSGFHRHG